MRKDAYYFPHFCNARHDRKIKRLRKQLGIEGYGIFFMLLEVLRDQTDFKYPTSDLDLLADEFGTSVQKVEAVVKGYDLFVVDDKDNLFSPKLLVYLQPYFERKEKATKAARTRWSKEEKHTPAMLEHSTSNAQAMQSKVKQSKVKKRIQNLFEEIWKNYPKKLGKKKAYSHFKASVKKEEDFQKIKIALKNYKKHIAGKDPQFIQHGATWFNNWQDWIDYEESKIVKRNTRDSKTITAEMIRRRYADENNGLTKKS